MVAITLVLLAGLLIMGFPYVAWCLLFALLFSIAASDPKSLMEDK